MAIRIIFLIICAIIAINLLLSAIGLILNINLYKKYGKQILIFFCCFAILIVAIYTLLAIFGLIDN